MRLLYSKQKTKYFVEEYWEHKLTQEYTVICPFDNSFHFLELREDGWYIGAYKGCRWDGATSWFDSRIILKGSLAHDILHWLIRDGCISPDNNSTIDKELETVIVTSNPDYPIWKGGEPILRVRARLIRRGTNLVNQTVGEKVKIYELL